MPVEELAGEIRSHERKRNFSHFWPGLFGFGIAPIIHKLIRDLIGRHSVDSFNAGDLLWWPDGECVCVGLEIVSGARPVDEGEEQEQGSRAET